MNKFYRKGKKYYKGLCVMKIIYHNKKVEKPCENYKEAQKLYNKDVAEKLQSTINFIKNAANLMDIKKMPSFHLHALKGDRSGTYGIDLGRRLGFRLIIKPSNEDGRLEGITDENEIFKSTTIILALEVTNHYE